MLFSLLTTFFCRLEKVPSVTAMYRFVWFLLKNRRVALQSFKTLNSPNILKNNDFLRSLKSESLMKMIDYMSISKVKVDIMSSQNTILNQYLLKIIELTTDSIIKNKKIKLSIMSEYWSVLTLKNIIHRSRANKLKTITAVKRIVNAVEEYAVSIPLMKLTCLLPLEITVFMFGFKSLGTTSFCLSGSIGRLDSG